MKIYIAGKITGDPNHFEKFEKIEKMLKEKGHKVFNPARNQGYCYKDYLDAGLQQLQNCEAVYMLSGWQDSKGATLEHDYAKLAGMRIIHQWEHEVGMVEC